jgi:hypothetical protein
MVVHLVDGTYELFRHFHGRRRGGRRDDRPFGAAAGVLHTVLELLETGATHVGVATDHVIESFRNDLWPGYKTGAGVDRTLLAQFEPLEEALADMGVVVWAMVELEADDALAAAARIASADEEVDQVCIWTPDKDLAQCVEGDRVVQVDRRARAIRNAAAVREKFGVDPARIPDLLALVGDAADGYPGVPGIGKVTAAQLVNRPRSARGLPARGARRVAGARAPVQGPGHAALGPRAVPRRRRPPLARPDARLRCARRPPGETDGCSTGRSPWRVEARARDRLARRTCPRVSPDPARPRPAARRPACRGARLPRVRRGARFCLLALAARLDGTDAAGLRPGARRGATWSWRRACGPPSTPWPPPTSGCSAGP